MANKIYPSADAALKGIVHDGQILAVGGFGLCGIPEALIDALHDTGVEEPDLHLEQRRRRRLRPGQAAGNAPDQEDDLQLRRREQGVRAPVPGRRAGARIHARRARWPRSCAPAAPASRPSSPGPASAPGAPKARSCANSTARPMSWSAALVPELALVKADGRPLRQPALPADRAQLQPRRRDGRQDLIVEVEKIVEIGESSPTTSTCRASTCTASCSTPRPRSASKKRTVSTRKRRERRHGRWTPR